MKAILIAVAMCASVAANEWSLTPVHQWAVQPDASPWEVENKGRDRLPRGPVVRAVSDPVRRAASVVTGTARTISVMPRILAGSVVRKNVQNPVSTWQNPIVLPSVTRVRLSSPVAAWCPSGT